MSWKCREETTRKIIPHSEWNYILGPPFLSNNETLVEDQKFTGWQFPGFDDSTWDNAVLQFQPVKMLPLQSPWKLAPRTIPALTEDIGRFSGVVKCEGLVVHHQWDSFVREDCRVLIPAGESVTVDVKTEYLTTAFLNLQCSGGKGSVITFLYAECYEKDLGVECAPFPMPRVKSNRADCSGRLYGMKDVYIAADGQSKA